jgi:hypothetical protein
MTATPSFEQNIMPVLKQYNGQMIWRLDLTRYEDVKQNAPIILQRIQSSDDGERMPPPPFPAFGKDFVALFEQWVKAGFPP